MVFADESDADEVVNEIQLKDSQYTRHKEKRYTKTFYLSASVSFSL